MSNRQGNLDRTFRLAFIRRKIRTAFNSQTVRAALLRELNTRGPDSELIVKMVERVPITRPAVVQPVQPIPQLAQAEPAQAVPAQPVPAQPVPAQPAQCSLPRYSQHQQQMVTLRRVLWRYWTQKMS